MCAENDYFCLHRPETVDRDRFLKWKSTVALGNGMRKKGQTNSYKRDIAE